jgi:chromosome segregation ATPase
MSKTELELLFDLLKEVREDQKDHGKTLAKQSAYLEGIDSDVKELKPIVAKNTNDISNHMMRTDLLEDLHKDNQKRIELSEARLEKLEEPVKAKEWIKSHLVAILGVLGTIASILAYFLTK